MDERLAEIRTIWKQNQWLYVVAGFLLGVLFQPFLSSVSTDVNAFLQDIVPEAVGIVFTVLIIDRLYQRREQEREKRELKVRLLRELGSRVNEVAKRASEELREQGWLMDGSLREIWLELANLEDAHLPLADLSEVTFQNVNLRRANLAGAKLYISELDDVNFQNAYLFNAKLQLATLKGTNFQGAELTRANFGDAEFDERTTLPDGNKWTPETDMRMFTDPTHPDFWRSDDPSSPAYHGNKEE